MIYYSGVVSGLGNCGVGQPIMAAAGFQAAFLLVREVSALQQQDRVRWSSEEPPRKAAAAMIGCPTSQFPKTDKHPRARSFAGGAMACAMLMNSRLVRGLSAETTILSFFPVLMNLFI